MKTIKILGMGCSKCSKLTANAEGAAKAAGIEYKLEKVTDLQEIIRQGVMMTPALVIDDKIVSAGRIPTLEQIRQVLEK
jgi:small redox-active disulfide protein 2